MTTRPANFTPGSVVSDTHRTVDIVPKLAEALFTLDEDRYFEYLGTGAEGMLTHQMVDNSFTASDDEDLITSLVLPFAIMEGLTTSEYSTGRKRPLVRDSDNAEMHLRVQSFVSEAVNFLFDALNEVAPEGYYFGAAEGDGADFGFWEVVR